MIMLMPMGTRSAWPSVNTPVTRPTRASSTERTLPPRLDLQPAAEQPGRLVEEDQDEDAEGEAVLPGGDQIRHAHGLDHPEDEPRDHGADDIARPPEQH